MALWQNIRTDSPSETGEEIGSIDVARPLRTTLPDRTVGGYPGEGIQMANIGKSISIKGDVVGDEDTVIEGRVEGRVELKNHHLTIGPNGDVQGEISAKQVTIVGRVAGNVVATERLELCDSGRVEGDLNTPRLLVPEGARLNGKINMAPASGIPLPPPGEGLEPSLGPPTIPQS